MMTKPQKVSFKPETVVCSWCKKKKPVYLFAKPKEGAEDHYATCKPCRVAKMASKSKTPTVSYKQKKWGVLVPQDPKLIHKAWAEAYSRHMSKSDRGQ